MIFKNGILSDCTVLKSFSFKRQKSQFYDGSNRKSIWPNNDMLCPKQVVIGVHVSVCVCVRVHFLDKEQEISLQMI